MKYNIYSIKAKSLRKLCVNKELCYDLNKYFDLLIDSVIEINDSAFLYQLRKLYHDDFEDLFINDLLLVDFKGEDFENNEFLKILFDGSVSGYNYDNIGISIVGKDNVKRRYVPYDKSSSKSKDCKMFFINVDYKDELDRRLLLDLPFDVTNSITPSKYFAYRGLYLTDSVRINNLLLNEDNVVVINDDYSIPNKKPLAIVSSNGDKEKYDFSKDPINSFDGEGLISFEYIDLINKQLKKDTTSIQARMPFIKGMLHKCDFKAFFKDVNTCVGVKIKDAFGIERDLNKVEIVLTVSMFKCYKWLKKIFKDKDVDPMKYFFEMFNKYDHALYIAGSDTSLSYKNKSKKTGLNYQYLSTMDLTRDEFDSLVNDGIEILNNVESEFANDIDLDDDNDLDIDKENIYKLAVRKNSNFLYDPKIKSIIASIKEGYLRRIMVGKFLTDGECRLLSSDLLALLLHLYKQSNLEENDKYNFIKNHCLIKNNHFYMPNNNIELVENNYYGILRNPHLSRNEEVLGKPYLQNDKSLCFDGDDKTVMDKYFGHLKGVIMVSKYSLFPMCLSGADFDGDLVKIYSNENIVKAIKRGVYSENDNGGLNRKLPIIVIEKDNSEYKQETLKYISYKTIKNTFSSNIGLISRMAYEYSELEKLNNTTSDFACRCAIVAGKDIDGAKTGKHPIEDINKLKQEYESLVKSNYKYGNYFWNIKKDFKSVKAFSCTVSNNKLSYLLDTNKRKNVEIIDFGNGSNTSRLPIYFKKAYEVYKAKNDDNSCGLLFKFEADTNWKETLDENILKEIKMLIKAYNDVTKISQSIVSGNELSRNRNYILTKLSNIYGYYYDEYKFNNMFDKVINYLILNVKNYEDVLGNYEYLLDNCNDDNVNYLLFNENYTEYDKPIDLFKNVLEYAEKKSKQVNILKDNDEKYLRDFNTILIRAIELRKDKSTWINLINQKAKYFLYNKIFEDNDIDVVKYVYACANRKEFFWNVIEKEDIIDNIC